MGRWLYWTVQRMHPALPRQPIALEEIAGGARGDDVGPDRAPAARARNEMVEGQVVRGVWLAAILAGEAVAQKYVEPGKCRMPGRRHVFLQRDDTRQLHFQRRAAYADVVMVDDVDAIEKHRLDRVLPRPQRQREIAQRPKVGVENQSRAIVQINSHKAG